MQKSIALSTRAKRPGAEDEVRLFTMTTRQAQLFHRVVVGLAKGARMPVVEAARAVERTVVGMLGGKLPRENLPAAFHELRLAFPILRPRDVKALPRAGCPRGRITAIVLGIQVRETVGNEEGVATADVPRTVLVELDDDQAAFHADAMREVMERDGCSKDDAWIWVNNLVGRLLAGAELKEETEELILMRAVGLFQALPVEEMKRLPLATEEDVRRWSFTEDRAR